MRQPLIITLVLLLTAPAYAYDTTVFSKNRVWTHKDTFAEVPYQVLHFIDWNQTLQLADVCSTSSLSDGNLVLGDCPSRFRVNTYFVSTAILHGVVAYVLPKKYRRFFQNSSAIMQMGVVTNNWSFGLKVKI